jgi:hypothetical protein
MLGGLADRMSGAALRFYDLTPPGTPDGALLDQTELATLDFVTVELDAGQIRATCTEGLARRSGRASWAQCVDRDGHVLFDCPVGEQDSGAPLEMNTVDFKKGGPVKLRSFAVGY